MKDDDDTPVVPTPAELEDQIERLVAPADKENDSNISGRHVKRGIGFLLGVLPGVGERRTETVREATIAELREEGVEPSSSAGAAIQVPAPHDVPVDPPSTQWGSVVTSGSWPDPGVFPGAHDSRAATAPEPIYSPKFEPDIEIEETAGQLKPLKIIRPAKPAITVSPSTAPKTLPLGPEDVRQKAEALGHTFDDWGLLPGEFRRIGGRCSRCRKDAEVVYYVPENYTDKQAVIQYGGDALVLRCMPVANPGNGLTRDT